MADGTITLKTDVDTAGVSAGLGKIKSAAGKVGKAFAAVGVAGAAAFVAMGKAAISSYAEYEQLVGGMETLFKQSSNTIIKYANDAYKTAGLSANQYMETITSFSASLLQSLSGDTAKAAEYGNQAVIDMSDNANKMGTDISRIQDAYQGFAKQNFTMLDNLKLGYGGSKTEMERLLADAEKIKAANGEMADYSIDSFADIVDAIHVVQDNMGITGTTAKEAATTIQGSLSMVKASWQNLLTGIADGNQDLDGLIDNFASSVKTLGANVLPRIQEVIQNIPRLITGLLPEVTAAMGQLIPAVVEGAKGIVDGLVQVLPGIVQSIVNAAPAIISAITEIAGQVAAALPSIIKTIVSALPTILPALIEGVTSLIQGLAAALPEIVVVLAEALPAIIESLVSSLDTVLPALINGATTLVTALVAALPQILPPLIQAVPTIIIALNQALVDNAPLLIQGFIQVFTAVIAAIPEIIASIVTAMVDVFKSLLPEGLKNAFSLAIVAASVVWQDLVAKLKSVWENIKTIFSEAPSAIGDFLKAAYDKVKSVWDGAISLFTDIWNNVKSAIRNAANNIAETLSSAWERIKAVWNAAPSAFASFFSAAWSAIQSVVGSWGAYFSGVWGQIRAAFSAASSFFASAFNAAANAIRSAFSGVASFFQGIWGKIKAVFSGAASHFASVGRNIVSGIIRGVTGAASSLFSSLRSLATNALNAAKSALGIASPSKLFRDEVGVWISEGIASGIMKAATSVYDSIEEIVTEAAKSKWLRRLDLAENVADVLEMQNEQIDDMLESEKKYYTEKRRLEIEADDKEYQERLAAAKDAAEIEKIKQDRIEAQQKKANDAYLAELKETADNERKINEARVKNGESVMDALKSMYNSFQDKIEKLADTQTKFADKLKKVTKDMIETVNNRASDLAQKGLSNYISKFSQLSKDLTEKETLYNRNTTITQLKQYRDLMSALKEREGMSEEFYDYIKSLDFEKGYKLAQVLLKKDAATFKNEVAKWQEEQDEIRKTAEFIGDEVSFPSALTDWKARTEALNEYADALKRLEKRSGGAVDFFREIREMEPEAGFALATDLLALSDADFEQYIADWKEYQSLAKRESKALYKSEADELANEIEDKFDVVKQEFFGIGKDAAEQFETGFLQYLKNALETARDMVSGAFNDLLPIGSMHAVGSIRVPAMATGGIVPHATLAMVGERGREAVLPLDRNTEWMDKLAVKVASIVGSNRPIILQLDGRELGRAVVNTGNATNRVLGASLEVK